MNQPIRLMLADDHSIILMGLKAVLEDCRNIEIVGTALSGKDAIRVFREERPDVLLLDYRMRDMNGDEVTRIILSSFPGARIIILTSYDLEADVRRAYDAGVRGYLLKETPLQELLRAVRSVHEGRTWFPDGILEHVTTKDDAGLSKRQSEVLEMVARGLNNREIATVYGFTESGTKQHLRKIFNKLGAATRAEAVAAALRKGILKGL